ncbi:MAG: thioesterase family protein [Trueperaceae bacterium]|jgi:acyl-CoA thioester hydrolase
MRLRVRFAETDQMGVAHHSAYVVWLEAGRVEWLRERGLSYRQIEENGISLAVSRLEVAYRAASYFDDELTLTATLLSVRSRRVVFGYEVHRGQELLATATTEHVPTDRTGRATTLPADWLTPLKRLLAESP